MPYKKVPCPKCGQPMSRGAELCRKCKPSYERTAVHREKMASSLAGKPKPWLVGRKRPQHSKVMKGWWTEERRAAKREEMLRRVGNPNARYHGLGKLGNKLKAAIGHCELCDSTKRLDIHHKDRNKKNQALSNLQVLCRRCHMREHAKAKETGWDSYHRKRREAR